ncbi:MAG: hypothetical protein ACPGWR_20350 [Ardenticatenaceae bacterium]
MSYTSYQFIQPLIVQAEQNNANMRCIFECPVTGERVKSSARIRRSQELTDVATRKTKQSLNRSFRHSIRQGILRKLGYNMFGYFMAEMASSVASDIILSVQSTFTAEEQENAIVEAFENVKSRFAWDEQNGRWLSVRAIKEKGTDFAKQLHTAPISERYDQSILARMLVEIATDDGYLAQEERAFLDHFMPSEFGSIQQLTARPSLTNVELEETSPGAPRESMFMLAWTVALTDQKVESSQEARLQAFATALKIASGPANKLKRFAQLFVIDQAIEQVYSSGQLDQAGQEQITRLAEQIALPPSEIQRAMIKYRKRNGLV